MSFLLRYTLLLVFIGIHSFSAISQPLFNQESVIEIRIEAPFDSVRKSDCNNPKNFKARLYINNNIDTAYGIEIRKRGKFRCDNNNCSYPPMFLYFGKDSTMKGGIFGNRKIKLVNPCRLKSKRYQDYVFKEYLVYKILAIFTPYSLKVRLAHITRVNTSNPGDNISYFGFFLERDEDMADRNKSKILNATNVKSSEFDSTAMNFVDVFQFMVGNTDWSVTEPHNIIILSTNPFKPPIPVPYDFDWSGAVNAYYAQPQPHLNLRSVLQRYYMGYCRSSSDLSKTLDTFKQKKQEVFNLVKSDLYLSSKGKKQLLNYLDDFYKEIENQNLTKSVLMTECLK